VAALDHQQHVHKRVSWQAIFAGVVIAIVVQALFSILGAGIGLAMVDPYGGGTPSPSGAGIGASIWWVITSYISIAIGGYIAAWLSGVTTRFDGALHGMVAWAIATIVAMFLVSATVSGVVRGTASVVGGAASAIGQGVSSAAPQAAQAAGLNPDLLQQQAQNFFGPANPDPASMSRQDAVKEVAGTLPRIIGGGPDAGPARDRVIAIMAAQLKISPEEATRRYDDALAQAVRAKDEATAAAKKAADTAASALSKGSILTFVVSVLGMLAAAFGGAYAIERRVLITDRMGRLTSVPADSLRR
jgi:hypothetical protein